MFACALDWPGWCRSGRDEDRALEALRAYATRYGPVAAEAGLRLPRVLDFKTVERVSGSASTDFGVPGEVLERDSAPVGAKDAARMADLVEAAWAAFDRVVAGAPAELRKGPRGGGRDRDKIVDHVLGAEATAYAPRLGLRIPQPAAGDRVAVAALREAILNVLRDPRADTKWPTRYAARRIAWHVLDHAWEIEDRSTA